MLGRAQIRNAPLKSAAARSVAAKKPSARQNPWQGVWRQAGWGLAAAAALSVAVLSSRDDAAPQKVAALLSSLRSQQPAAHSFDAETAARQLAQAMRGLADDRDKLAMRLIAVEREMRDMSGAIKQQIEAAKTEAIKTAKQAPPWPESAPPVRKPYPRRRAAPPSRPPRLLRQARTTPTSTRRPTRPRPSGKLTALISTLHHRWVSLRTAHPQLFEGVQPVVSVKQNPRTGRTELHLIVGPYANAETAAQFCDFVVPFHVNCQPAMFDGSRLALR